MKRFIYTSNTKKKKNWPDHLDSMFKKMMFIAEYVNMWFFYLYLV